MKIHLLDGTLELFRAYHGGPSRKDKDGTDVGAVLTLMSSVEKLLRRDDVTHVACAFDQVIESFRNRLFPGYKSGEGIEPDLLAQFSLAEEAIAALGVVVWPMVEFECDDALATAAMRFADDSRVEKVVICSSDKDFAQCVTDKVCFWDRGRDRHYGVAEVREKWGIDPESMTDYLALVGDSADGIPGVPRWGAKSASRILNHYRHLESIPASADEWAVQLRGASGLAQSLNDHRGETALYKELATLRLDVPLEENLEDLEYHGVSERKLWALEDKLGRSVKRSN